MNFFQSLWHRITRQELVDTLYQTINKNLQTIEELNSQEQEYKNTILEKEKLLKGYADLMAERDEEIEDLQNEINTLRIEENIYPLPSIDVDWDKHPYFPGTIFTYYDKDLKENIDVNAQLTPSKFYRVYSDEMYNYVINGMKKYSNKSQLEQVIKLRDLVCDRVTYHSDLSSKGIKIENWKLPMQTYYQKKGDCDDMCVLFVTFCKIYGIPTNQVFNLTGFCNTTGHSFGGYLDTEGTMWIVECTSKLPIIKMKGSAYRCKGHLSGLSNSQFSGVPLVEQF
jgi:hypothetical protein